MKPGLLRVVDDRAEEVGDAFVERELEPLGVDEDELDLVGRRLVEDAGDHGVEGDALPGPGGPGDQEMGHDGQVGDVDLAVDGLAQGEGQLRRRIEELLGLDDVPELDDLALVVGDLDAQRGFARDPLDADRFGLEGEGQVLGQVGHLGDLDAGVGEQLVGRDDGAGVVLADLAGHVELLELVLDPALLFEELVLVDLLRRLAGLEKAERREIVVALLAEVGKEQVLRRGGIGGRSAALGFLPGLLLPVASSPSPGAGLPCVRDRLVGGLLRGGRGGPFLGDLFPSSSPVPWSSGSG